MLLNVPKMEGVGKVGNCLIPSPPWWINPFSYSLLFLLPFFLITVFTSGPYLHELKQETNNLNSWTIFLGVLSALSLAVGAAFFSFSKPTRLSWHGLDIASRNRALLFMGYVSLLCNLIYFSSLVLNPQLIFIFLSGDSSAMYKIRGVMEQIPGITSFMSACLPFFALYSFSTIQQENKSDISKLNHKLFYILFFFVFARSILGSERIAFVEAIVSYGIPRIVFSWRPSKLRSFMPFIGMIGVFCLFSFGEYFRSWQHYKMHYDSFFEFITVRFFGYFATSINNGAGVVTYYDAVGLPAYTVDGFYKLLRIFNITLSPAGDTFANYLNRYATPEFNNPGGLYVPYMDYGAFGGSLFFIFIGAISGWLYKKFLEQSPFGLLLYPVWFIGLLDIMRIWFWGNSRFVPVVIISSLAILFLKKGKCLESSYTNSHNK